MWRNRVVAVGSLVALAAVALSATSVYSKKAPPPAVTREVIAVYIGTEGTDGGMATVVGDMKTSLARQALASGRKFVSRGVSLEPGVPEGLAHLARLGPFDEVSLGGNWTNSAVVRYLGNNIGRTRDSAIPQVVLLEREVTTVDFRHMDVGPEREIGRFIGTGEIDGWVRRGAPLPK